MGALYPPRLPAILGDLSQGLRPPQLLKIAEAINGEDFTPFNEALFIKEPGVGAAVSCIKTARLTGKAMTLIKISTDSTLWLRSMAAPRSTVCGCYRQP